jgi:NAD(P)H-quinone oxidoreductase subunit 6
MPSTSVILFYLLAALTIGSAAVVALSRNVIYSALALLGTFLGVAGLYITLAADFLAATQLLVYVGGTLTLILFAVMLTARIDKTSVSNPKQGFLAGLALVIAVLIVLGLALASTPWAIGPGTTNPSTTKLGHAFLNEYLLPFEIGSVVLLAAMIGSVVLARRAIRPEADGD